jgi:hypothetical protein
MKTLKTIKKELGLPNYRKEVFNIEFIDHAESDGECFIELNTGNKDNDLANLKRIQEYLKLQTKEVLYLEACIDIDYAGYGLKKYFGSTLCLKLK